MVVREPICAGICVTEVGCQSSSSPTSPWKSGNHTLLGKLRNPAQEGASDNSSNHSAVALRFVGLTERDYVKPHMSNVYIIILFCNDQTLLTRIESAWQKMVQYPLNGSTQPVDTEEEGLCPTTVRQWQKKYSHNWILCKWGKWLVFSNGRLRGCNSWGQRVTQQTLNQLLLR